MRLRIPELLEERQWTAYQLWKRSGGRISRATAYRLEEWKGGLGLFDGELLEALCDVFEVEPGELFVRESEGVRERRKDRQREKRDEAAARAAERKAASKSKAPRAR